MSTGSLRRHRAIREAAAAKAATPQVEPTVPAPQQAPSAPADPAAAAPPVEPAPVTPETPAVASPEARGNAQQSGKQRR